jgi:non-ribosomal peptide synthase protein (TIGR01720 family)
VTESPAAYLTEHLTHEETRMLLSTVPSFCQVQLLDVLLTACVITYVKYAQLNPTVITVLHHGRNPWLDELDLLRTVGNIYTSYPFLVDVGVEMAISTPRKTLELIANQRARIPNQGCTWHWVAYYSMGERSPLREYWEKPGHVAFNYLGQTNLNSLQEPQFFREVPKRTEATSAPESYQIENRAPHTCSVLIENGQLKVTWEYFSQLDDKATITGLLQTYLAVLRQLISESMVAQPQISQLHSI